MTLRLRHPLRLEHIVFDAPIDRREAFVVEQLDTGKTRFWKCPCTPSGKTILASARPTNSIPLHLLGRVWRVLQGLDANGLALQIRRAS